MLAIFNGSDQRYRKWLKAHIAGFVINTRRRTDPDYMVLHRAACSSISRYTSVARSGAFTERAYIKVCGEKVEELRSWAKSNGRPDGSFSIECSRCKPL